MAKLPFIVEPKSKPTKMKIGNEDVGIFEIERRGYLTVAEKSFVEGFTSSSGTIRDIVKISNQISIRMKISREDAYKLLMSVMSGNLNSKVEKEISSTFEQEIGELTSLMTEVQSKRMLAIATILLQSRVNAEWTLDDTLQLDPLVLDQLSDLYDLEESKVKPPVETKDQSDEEIAELLGK